MNENGDFEVASTDRDEASIVEQLAIGLVKLAALPLLLVAILLASILYGGSALVRGVWQACSEARRWFAWGRAWRPRASPHSQAP